MFAKLPRCLLFARLNSVHLLHKYETSALYVTGDRAQETYSVLVPYFDLDARFANLEKLEENIKLRNMNLHVDQLKKLWDLYKIAINDRDILERRRLDIVDKIRQLKLNNPNEAEADIAKYILEGKIVREDLKVLMKGVLGLEKQAIIKSLALPNDLDDETPRNDIKLVHEFKKPSHGPITQGSSEVGQPSYLVDYSDPSCYYLKDKTAEFELEMQYYFAEALQKKGFIQFSNADFAWSVVVEGCGGDHRDPNFVFTLQDDDPNEINQDHRLHLVGGASLVSFCSFHAKQFVDPNSLPLKYFALGRQYTPSKTGLDGDNSGSIYNSWQASAVELFIASRDEVASKNEFTEILNAVISFYEELGHHFRVVYLPPPSLRGWECLRASFQMYLLSRGSYVEVGNISMSNTFISKRLLMCYKSNKQEQHYLSLVSGTVLSVPKLLACMLENVGLDGVHVPQLPKTL